MSDLPKIITEIPGPRSLELAARLARVESPDTTFFSREFPVFWSGARGCVIEDVDGNRYLDLTSAFGVAAVGHAHPGVARAVADQAERLMHGMGDVHPHEAKAALAEAVTALAPPPGPWKVIFGTGGAEAVEAALKTAAIATGKPGVIAFENAYHGLTLGTLGVTAWPKFRAGLEGMLPAEAVRFEFPREGDAGAAERVLGAMEAFLASDDPRAVRIGAVLYEPIQGRAGVVIPPPDFLPGLRKLCNAHGLLMIADEIYTGFGRAGDWFASPGLGAVPDIIAAGKALGGGMPISVCIGRAEIIDKWGKSEGEARHTSTFLGHPLACAAALATVGALKDEGLIARSESAGREFREFLKARLGGVAAVAEIRGRGMMIGVDIIEPTSGEPSGARAWKCVVDGLRRGLILLPCGPEGATLSITPPLTIGAEQMEFAAQTLAEVLS